MCCQPAYLSLPTKQATFTKTKSRLVDLFPFRLNHHQIPLSFPFYPLSFFHQRHTWREKIRLCFILSWWCGDGGIACSRQMWILSVPLIHSTHHKERINEEENGILSNERASQNGTKNRSRRKAKAVSRHRMYFVCTVVNLQTRFSHAYLITCYIIIVILRHILFLFFPIFVKTSTSSVQAHVP